eukprot:1182058-Prorocentrum_minimum.AAC.2
MALGAFFGALGAMALRMRNGLPHAQSACYDALPSPWGEPEGRGYLVGDCMTSWPYGCNTCVLAWPVGRCGWLRVWMALGASPWGEPLGPHYGIGRR